MWRPWWRCWTFAAALLAAGCSSGASGSDATVGDGLRDAALDRSDDALTPDGGPSGDLQPLPDSGPWKAYPLPMTIDFGGEAGPLVVADFDGDRYLDIAALVAPQADPTRWDVVIVWGDAAGKLDWTSTLTLPGAWPADPSGRTSPRDLPSSVLAQGHFLFGQPRRQLITAGGVVEIDAKRALLWRALPLADKQLGAPVRLVVHAGVKTIIRGTIDGLVERCDSLTQCVPLAGQTARSCAGQGVVCMTSDLEVADFDGDGAPDVIAGVAPWDVGEKTTTLWLMNKNKDWPIPQRLAIDAGDYEVGDVDGDGKADLVAQRHETISDFPSQTDIWLSTLGVAGATAPFALHQTLYNWDNHNDNAALVDLDGDGCLDFAMTGVDVGSGYKLGTKVAGGNGCTGFIGPHDPSKSLDSGGWKALDVRGSTGIQIVDVNGDGKKEALIRNAEFWQQGSSKDSVYLVALP